MAVVAVVSDITLQKAPRPSLPRQAANRNAPTAPTAADSVSVKMPK